MNEDSEYEDSMRDMCANMLEDPNTIKITIQGIEVILNKPRQFIGCTKDQNMDGYKFLKILAYLKKEGFLDDPED